MEGRKSAALFLIVMGSLILVLVGVSIAGDRRGTKEEHPFEGVRQELPDAEIRDVASSKSEAITAARSRRQYNIEAYYDSCEVASGMEVDRNEDPMKSIGAESSSATEDSILLKARTEDLFPPEASSASVPVSRTVSCRETPSQREARHQRRREEAIDLASSLSGAKTPEGDTPDPERIFLPADREKPVRESGVISSLSGSGGGVSSLEKPSTIHTLSSGHPFRCVFPRQEKLRSGQRVSIRLTEDMLVASSLIPRNTHLQAYVTIGSRLELEIGSIEMNDHILPLGCIAFDTDGMKGIYCPEAGEAKRVAKTSALGAAGSLVGGRVGRLAAEMVSTGVSLAQTSSGERTVTVPAGYTFFIARKQQ